MKYQTILTRCVGVAAAISLAGCSGVGVFPDSAANPVSSSVGAITGSNYGGHAPLVGAHIYLVQPGTTGYGSVVSSLLTVNANAGTYPLVANGSWPTATSGGNASDQFVPATDANGNGFNGVTTNLNGEFALSGDYSCVPNLPVILIGYGGYPSFVPTTTGGTNTFAITSVQVSNLAGQAGGAGTATYTINTSGTPPVLFYPGETVSFAGTSLAIGTGANAGFFNSGTYVVSAANLATNSFQLTFNGDYGGYPTAGAAYFPAQTTNQSGATVTATPSFNPAAVNMAVLGNCPSNGTFATGASAIKYVYMNEISTVATAYAFAGFTNSTATSTTGYDEFHLGAPSTNLIGLRNAALTAGNLYDIQGGNTASNNPDGDVHIARMTTPSGNGSVAQTTIDNLGNILAACVDSTNTYRINATPTPTGTQSSQCQLLAYYSPDNGTTATATTHQSANIAQAAFSIARYPQIDGSASITALYNIPTGNIPFTPQLSAAPNDWSVVIGWSDSAANGGTAIGVQDVAVDSQGNVWAPTRTGVVAQVFQFSPAGVVTGYTDTPSTQTEQIAIDTSDRAWVPGAVGSYRFTSGTAAGVAVGSVSTSTVGGGIAVDTLASPNQYIANAGRTALASLVKQTYAGASSFNTTTPTTCAQNLDFVTLDSAGRIWTATAYPFAASTAYVCLFGTNGVNILSYPLNYNSSTFTLPHFLATDAGDNVWFAEKQGGTVYKISQDMTVKTITVTPTAAASSGGFPIGVMVDGANTTWVSYQSVGSGSVGGLIQYSNADVAKTPTYLTGGAIGNGTETVRRNMGGIAADPSGNIWTTSGGTLIYEFVGAATPTVTPISSAKANGKVGQRP